MTERATAAKPTSQKPTNSRTVVINSENGDRGVAVTPVPRGGRFSRRVAVPSELGANMCSCDPAAPTETPDAGHTAICSASTSATDGSATPERSASSSSSPATSGYPGDHRGLRGAATLATLPAAHVAVYPVQEATAASRRRSRATTAARAFPQHGPGRKHKRPIVLAGLAARDRRPPSRGVPARTDPLRRLPDYQPLQDEAAQRADRRVRVSALLLLQPVGRHPRAVLRVLRAARHPLDAVQPPQHQRLAPRAAWPRSTRSSGLSGDPAGAQRRGGSTSTSFPRFRIARQRARLLDLRVRVSSRVLQRLDVNARDLHALGVPANRRLHPRGRERRRGRPRRRAMIRASAAGEVLWLHRSLPSF